MLSPTNIPCHFSLYGAAKFLRMEGIRPQEILFVTNETQEGNRKSQIDWKGQPYVIAFVGESLMGKSNNTILQEKNISVLTTGAIAK
mgnify:CR=1 FL=1